MLSISNSAMQHLHDALQSVATSSDDGRCFRIIPKDGGNLMLSLAEPTPTDKKFEFDGNTVLAVPAELQEFCADKSLELNKDGKLELS